MHSWLHCIRWHNYRNKYLSKQTSTQVHSLPYSRILYNKKCIPTHTNQSTKKKHSSRYNYLYIHLHNTPHILHHPCNC